MKDWMVEIMIQTGEQELVPNVGMPKLPLYTHGVLATGLTRQQAEARRDELASMNHGLGFVARQEGKK